MTTIADNVNRVQDQISDACARVGRNSDEVTLVAVSKRKPVADVLAAIEAGLQHFAENRVEESNVKLPQVAQKLGDLPAPTWHFVGHIQSRKAKAIIPAFSVIHSLDSVKLAEKLGRIVEETGSQTPDIFIQVNVSGEQQKYGFQGYNWEQDKAVSEPLFEELHAVLSTDRLNVRGLMTMAPYDASEAELRAVFASLANLKQELETQFSVVLADLSMGMTDDYLIAIEEGATLVRVGRALFGERDY